MSNQMLIIGSNGGVGKECQEFFSKTHDVIPISRKNGDLRSKDFLNEIINNYSPSIVINCAGVYDVNFYETFEVNFIASSYLTFEFYKKMKSGHIINICSSGANSTGWRDMDYNRIFYNVSKKSLKNFSNMLQISKNQSVKVTSIEPAQINTKMGDDRHKGNIVESEYIKQTKELIPMKPSYIAEVIDWILRQPDPVVISSIEIQNLIVKQK